MLIYRAIYVYVSQVFFYPEKIFLYIFFSTKSVIFQLSLLLLHWII